MLIGTQYRRSCSHESILHPSRDRIDTSTKTSEEERIEGAVEQSAFAKRLLDTILGRDDALPQDRKKLQVFHDVSQLKKGKDDDRKLEGDDDVLYMNQQVTSDDWELEKNDDNLDMEQVVTTDSVPDTAELDYEVADILNQRVNYRGGRGSVEYLVSWKGYDQSANTWEPEPNLRNAMDILTAFKKRVHGVNQHKKRRRNK